MLIHPNEEKLEVMKEEERKVLCSCRRVGLSGSGLGPWDHVGESMNTCLSLGVMNQVLPDPPTETGVDLPLFQYCCLLTG